MIVFGDAEFIATRPYYGFLVNLYVYDGLFIEVFYSQQNNAIEKIESIHEDLVYKGYWDKIELDL